MFFAGVRKVIEQSLGRYRLAPPPCLRYITTLGALGGPMHIYSLPLTDTSKLQNGLERRGSPFVSFGRAKGDRTDLGALQACPAALPSL